MAVTDRQRRFAEIYEATGDAAQAAKAAGYPAGKGAQALRSRGVQRFLQDRERPGPSRVADAEEVLEYLTQVLRGEADPEGRGGAASPRMKAAELLGKRLGLFSEAVEGAKPPVILDDIPGGGGP